MAVNLIHFEHQGAASWGVVRDGQIAPIPGRFASTRALLQAVDTDSLRQLDGPTLAESDVSLLSPITRDQQLVCQGANYRQHMIESGVDPDAKSFNMIFGKATSAIVPADAAVVRPPNVQFLDYEIELGLVLGRDIDGPAAVTDDTLLDFVAGLVIFNDYSARGIQIPQMQFYKGKSFRTFGPVGPYLCLLEPGEARLVHELDLELRVNGEVRQRDNTRNLVHGPAATLTELFEVQDFRAGDLIATGTPAGCALTVPSPLKQRLAAVLPEATKWRLFLEAQAKRTQYLQPGDVVEARIRTADGGIDLGVQRNRIAAPA